MRELTIIRQKTGVGCLGTIQFYISDPAGDTKIQGQPCRLLGKLKNNQQKTFQVPEEACRIFAIAGKMSAAFCNEGIDVPAGTEPVTLSGKCCYDLARGNAFRFDGNDNPDTLQQRKKSRKLGFVVLAIALAVGFCVGWFVPKMLRQMDKTFTVGDLQITLTQEFEKASYSGFDAVFESSDYVVFCTEEPFDWMPLYQHCTVEEYAELVIDANGYTAQVQQKSGVTYFTYTSVVNGTRYRYYATTHKGSEAFWLVQFACLESQKEELEGKFIQWARSVEVD